MSVTTKIAWADSTASPWFGCTEVSPGCVNCYAREMTLRRGWAGWGDDAPRVRSKGFEKLVRKLNRVAWVCDTCGSYKPHLWDNKNGVSCRDCGTENNFRRPRVFPSLMDWLDPQVPVEWLADLLNIVADTPNLDWLLLTKRPELCFDRVNQATRCSHYRGAGRLWTLAGLVPHNVWIGVTCEDQTRIDQRIPELLKIPAKVRFLSVEPLLEPIDLSKWIGYNPVHDSDGRERSIRLRGCEIRASHNQAGWNDLEEQGKEAKAAMSEPSAEFKISHGKSDAKREAGEHTASAIGLPSLQGSNSAWTDDKSQRRDDYEQSARQSRTGDLCRSGATRETSTRQIAERPRRREERHGKTDGKSCSGNTQASDSGGTTQEHSSGLPNFRPNGFQDSQGRPLDINFVIVGGESGPKRRDCGWQAIRDVAKQCVAAGVPVFVKQDCAFKPGQQGRLPDEIWQLKQFPK